MTKKEILQDLVNDLATLTNNATSKEEAISKGLSKYLFIDFARHYGGYVLVFVNIDGGGHRSTFVSSSYTRQSYKTFEQMLRVSLNTLKYIK